MNKYSKAIAAFLTSLVGLGIAFGFVTEVAAQNLTVMATAVANLVAVWFIPNAKD